MKKNLYTIMILDDNLNSTLMLQRLLKRIEYVDVLYCLDNTDEALNILHIQQIDILILDMDMPVMMGWEFVKLLDRRPVILAFTGYTKYSFYAQEIGVRGYMSKMLSWDILKKAIDDCIREADYQSELTKDNSTFVKVRNYDTKMEEIILHEDLYYAEVEDKTVTLYLKGRNAIQSLMSLSKLMEDLPTNKFVRISARHLVGLHGVSGCSRKEVRVRENDKALEILYPNAYVKLQQMLDNAAE